MRTPKKTKFLSYRQARKVRSRKGAGWIVYPDPINQFPGWQKSWYVVSLQGPLQTPVHA
jgi:hypothetical protein